MSKQTRKTPLGILKAALKLVSDPKRWTKSVFAVDKNGYSVPSTDPSAVRWCAVGALTKIGGKTAARYAAARALTIACGGVGITDVNDGRNGRKRIIAAFQRAIKKLAKKASAE